MFTLVRWIIFLALTQMPFIVHASPSYGLSIHSITRVGNSVNTALATNDRVFVNVEYSYDGSMGEMFVSAMAVSGYDWDTHSPITASALMSPGLHKSMSVSIDRPSQTKEITQTSNVVILASARGVYPIYRKVVELPVQWPSSNYSWIHGAYPSMAIVSALGAGDYEDIDRILTYWIDENKYDKNGDWRIDQFYETFRAYFEHDRDATLGYIRKWRKAVPESRAAALAEASYWVVYASNLRGYIAPGKTVDKDVLRVMQQYDGQAKKILNQSIPIAKNTPIWHWLQLKIAIDGNMSAPVINKIFDDSVQAFPQYQRLYNTMVAYLVAEGGKQRWAQINDVADRVQKATLASSTGGYAKLVSEVGMLAYDFVPNIYSAKIASWSRAKDSWAALIISYPTPYNMNQFAAQACKANDKDTLLTLLGRIGDRIVPEAWPANYSADLCKRRIAVES